MKSHGHKLSQVSALSQASGVRYKRAGQHHIVPYHTYKAIHKAIHKAIYEALLATHSVPYHIYKAIHKAANKALLATHSVPYLTGHFLYHIHNAIHKATLVLDVWKGLICVLICVLMCP